MPSVVVSNLSKTFKVPVREPGLLNSIRSLFKREFRVVDAVKDVSFELEPGVVVGFLGPNGAGKTTTLKMLSGLLYPNSGDARVLGYRPEDRQADFLSRVALVMGNRNSLQWDLPVADSLDLRRAIYQVPHADFKRRKDAYIELLDVGDLLTKPVRNLSLGERMKMEILAALLPNPEVLFLDEPTLGLDISMQKRIRRFVAEYTSETGATALLTSHYMADVTALCERVIVIHRGGLLFDGDLRALADRFSATKTITITTEEALPDLSALGTVVVAEPSKVALRVDRDRIASVAAELLRRFSIIDLSIEDPPIEDVIEGAFAMGDLRLAEDA